MEKTIHDKELGTILLRTSPRATRYTLKISNGRITATMPPKGDEVRMLNFIRDNKNKLLTALAKHPARPILTDKTELQTATFSLHIICTNRTNFHSELENGILRIDCPSLTNFADERIQKILKEMIEQALRHEACRLLPTRLFNLATRYGFSYTGVKIFNSKSHWGSCTLNRSINLSLSLMLLPWHLIDYVLLHELCHTIEMNHSDRFWNLMNKVTEGKALELKRELKNFHML